MITLNTATLYATEYATHTWASLQGLMATPMNMSDSLTLLAAFGVGALIFHKRKMAQTYGWMRYMHTRVEAVERELYPALKREMELFREYHSCKVDVGKLQGVVDSTLLRLVKVSDTVKYLESLTEPRKPVKEAESQEYHDRENAKNMAAYAEETFKPLKVNGAPSVGTNPNLVNIVQAGIAAAKARDGKLIIYSQ